MIQDKTQKERILDALREAKGEWVSGMDFLKMVPAITQFHARIWELQKQGYEIEGRFINDNNWKYYRLVSEPQTVSLVIKSKPEPEPEFNLKLDL